ncbi:hypothetical protein MHYP_G00033270 [Metynnis hypsauchen]
MSPKWMMLTVLIFHLCAANRQLGPKPGPAPAPDPDSELITYCHNCAPCERLCNNTKNENFNKYHLAELSSFGTDRELWTNHIKDINVCKNIKGIKSFLEKSQKKQVEEVCSPSGGKLFERGKNLCISKQAFSFIEVRWDENCNVWDVSKVTQHIILACDEIDFPEEKKCLPVHFEDNSQKYLPVEEFPNCNSSEEEGSVQAESNDEQLWA